MTTGGSRKGVNIMASSQSSFIAKIDQLDVDLLTMKE